MTGTPRITDAQARCLRLAADGHPDRAIAAITGLQIGTVKTHIKRARQLYGGVTRTRAIALAARQIRDLPDDLQLPCCDHCAEAVAALVELRAVRGRLPRIHPWARLYDRLADALIGAATPDRRRAAA